MTVPLSSEMQGLLNELIEQLRVASYEYQHKQNGRWDGAIRACHAVSHFLLRAELSVELAVPPMAIEEGLKE